MNIKTFFALVLLAFFFTACTPSKEKPIFSGRVEFFYYADEGDNIAGFTRFEKGFSGTSTRVKEDIWLDVYTHWVVATLKNRKNESYLIPRERVRHIVVGTKEGNELNAPK
jgi:hypothetical protein